MIPSAVLNIPLVETEGLFSDRGAVAGEDVDEDAMVWMCGRAVVVVLWDMMQI